MTAITRLPGEALLPPAGAGGPGRPADAAGEAGAGGPGRPADAAGEAGAGGPGRPGRAGEAGARTARAVDAEAPAERGGPAVGVLAVQGDVLEHVRMLAAAGAEPRLVRTPADLERIDGLVIPGGESTTIGKLCVMYGLLEPIRKAVAEGMPAFGTCAGGILLARKATLHDGRASDQPLLGLLDVTARRNAFGRQVASFETDLDVADLDGGPVHAVFIRAPWFEDLGPDTEPLAEADTPLGARVVVVRQGHLLASAFHPELTADGRLHALFVERVRRGQR